MVKADCQAIASSGQILKTDPIVRMTTKSYQADPTERESRGKAPSIKLSGSVWTLLNIQIRTIGQTNPQTAK